AAGAAAAGAAPSAAAASPSGFSSSFFLAFLTTILMTRTLGSPNGLRPSGQRSSSRRGLMGSPRVKTLPAGARWFLRRSLFLLVMRGTPGGEWNHDKEHEAARQELCPERAGSVSDRSLAKLRSLTLPARQRN